MTPPTQTAGWSNPRAPFALASDRAPLSAPEGRPIIVNLACNIEWWPFDRPMPRGVLPAPHGRPSDPPDVPNFAWVEYGLRAGMPRLLRILGERGLRASALLNAQVAEVYPTLMEAVVGAEWELVGHGQFQRTLKQAEDEAGEIYRSLALLRAHGPVRAWLGPGLAETDRTPDLLRAEGIEFLHDWYLDDLPVWMRTEAGPMLAMPYAFALNDVPMYAIEHAATDEWLRRVEATLAVFAEEARTQPRVMTLALHPHVIGVPHVAHWFAKSLDLLLARDDVIFMTSSQIGDWFAAQAPAPEFPAFPGLPTPG